MFLASRSLRHISLIPGKWLIFCSKNNNGQLFVNIGSEDLLRSLLSYETQIFIPFFLVYLVLFKYIMWIIYIIGKFWRFEEIWRFVCDSNIIFFGAQPDILLNIRWHSFITFVPLFFSFKVILRCHSLTKIINIWKKN